MAYFKVGAIVDATSRRGRWGAARTKRSHG